METESEFLGRILAQFRKMEDQADLWRDEFARIRACIYGRGSMDVDSEILGICDRVALDIQSKISLIDQREKVAEENYDLRLLAGKLRRGLEIIWANYGDMDGPEGCDDASGWDHDMRIVNELLILSKDSGLPVIENPIS